MLVVAAVAGGAVVAAFAIMILASAEPAPAIKGPNAPTTPVAVLGDSDSAAYHDSVSHSRHPEERGGPFWQATYNWTEVLAQLRAAQLDFGPWGQWGSRRPIGLVRDRLGLATRLPRKQDFRHNLAFAGATCGELLEGPRRQVPRLLHLMRADPGYWARGVVVIRIGINTLGDSARLAQLANDPGDAQAGRLIEECTDAILRSVQLLRSEVPSLRVMLVGIFNEADAPHYHELFHSRREIANITRGLDRFDEPLRKFAADSVDVAFFDDRAWFAAQWGTRDERGHPAYRQVAVGNRGYSVGNTQGDEPRNSVLADGHAGAIWNGLWAAAALRLMNDELRLGVPELTEQEILELIDAEGRLGMR